MEADCFRYGKPSMLYHTMVIPVRLTSFAQGDCIPYFFMCESFKILHKKIHAIRIACIIFIYMGFANIILPAEVCSTDVTSTRITFPI